MTKSEFISSFAERHRIPRSSAKRIVNLVFGHVYEMVKEGQAVRIPKVGRFHFKYTPPRIARDNFRDENVSVGPRIRLQIKPFRSLTRTLNEGLAKQIHEETK